VKRCFSYFVVVVLLLPNLGIGKRKEENIDPRLKQIHTIFLKGDKAATDDIQAKQAQIEKNSCLRLVPDAETADAVLKVNYSPGGYVNRTGSMRNAGLGTEEWKPYHTGFELSAREGKKLKKIWAKEVDLDEQHQQAQHGVFRLMDSLSQDACGGR